MREEWIAFAPAALLAAWTGYRAWRLQMFLARAVRAKGRITGYSEEHRKSRSGGGRTQHYIWYYPHVEFPLEDGTPFQFQSPVYEVHRSGVGTEVRVAYLPRRPATAVIEGDLAWRPVGRAGLATVVVLGITLYARFCG
jgi:hypothetical protein